MPQTRSAARPRAPPSPAPDHSKPSHPPSLPATAATLPLEILDHIFTLAKGPFPSWKSDAMASRRKRENPNPTLLSASLVCKAWAEAAQRVLYLHAVFPVDPRSNGYAAWVASAGRKRHHTVSLWISPSADAAFKEVIESCEGLERLALGGPLLLHKKSSCGVERWNADWSMLRAPSLKQLKVLSIPYPSTFVESNPAASTPLPFSLSSLSLYIDMGDPQPDFLATLFSSSKSTLHTLRLRITDVDNIVYRSPLTPPVLSSFAPHLTHLIIEQDAHPGLDLSKFESLKTLDMRSSRQQCEWPESYLVSTIATLPLHSPLQHLVLELWEANEVFNFTQNLDYERLEKLESMEFPTTPSSHLTDPDEIVDSEGLEIDDSEDWPEQLRATCQEREISLVCEDGPVEW